MAIDDNTSYELTGYQVKDLASKIRAKADSNSLASVATSGLYSDLTGAPTIPTVYNGTLTIQQNGTQLGTFSANQSSNTTINITGGGGGQTLTKFYSSDYVDNNNVTLYKDASLATHATYKDVIDALQGGGVEWVTISNSVQSSFFVHMYSVDTTTWAPETAIDISFLKQYNPTVINFNKIASSLSSNAVFSTQTGKYTLPTAAANTLGGVKVGSNLSISSGVLSANAMTGATSSADGDAGYVPQPLIADENKYLKGNGTWDTPPNTTYTAGSNISIDANNEISATDTTYSNFTGATSSVAGAAGLVPAPAAGDEGKALHGDGTWKDTTAKLVEMSYGESNAWAKFIAAYNAGSIVYCRASSNANPGTGSQTRKAFMAYVNNATSPTNVEFQYVRSQSSKTDSQQCDQVFVYTLTNTGGGTWSVASRNMGPKIVAGTGMSSTFTTGANATITLNAEPDYSASEVDTKVKWIDGKTIYRKTVDFGYLPDNSTKSVDHNISNLDKIIKVEQHVDNGSSATHGFVIIPSATAANTGWNLYGNDTQIKVATTSDRSTFRAYFTLYYTKSS